MKLELFLYILIYNKKSLKLKSYISEKAAENLNSSDSHKFHKTLYQNKKFKFHSSRSFDPKTYLGKQNYRGVCESSLREKKYIYLLNYQVKSHKFKGQYDNTPFLKQKA